MLNESVKEEATWHLRGPLPLLKTPEALMEQHRNDGELLELTYQSDSLQTVICSHCLKSWESELVAGAPGPPSSPLLKHCGGRLPAPRTASHWGAALLDQAGCFCSPAVQLCHCFQLSIGFFYTFKSGPYCILK